MFTFSNADSLSNPVIIKRDACITGNHAVGKVTVSAVPQREESALSVRTDMQPQSHDRCAAFAS
jgi:hypothetical protein